MPSAHKPPERHRKVPHKVPITHENARTLRTLLLNLLILSFSFSIRESLCFQIHVNTIVIVKAATANLTSSVCYQPRIVTFQLTRRQFLSIFALAFGRSRMLSTN